MNVYCNLAQYAMDTPCEGRLERAHLIPQQLMKREGLRDHVTDPATWVPACRRHHTMLDVSRTIRVPWDNLPEATIVFAADHGLMPWLEREYLNRKAS